MVRVLRNVTPGEAAAWLAAGAHPPPDPDKVALMVAAMRAGKWNPDLHTTRPIVVNAGRLKNGNHRCHAIIAHGQPVPMHLKLRRMPDAENAEILAAG